MIEGLETLAPILDVVRFATKDWSTALEDVGKAVEEVFSKGGGVNQLSSLLSLIELTPGPTGREFGNVLSEDQINALGILPGGNRSAVDQLFESANEQLTGSKQTAALAGLEAMTGAFDGLGQAVGSVVESFVLYGNAGTSVRKVTAQILAGVAAQAAVKAVFELAEGFAALALTFFGMPNAGPSAAAHFTAAAIYGGIAGVAAITGRAVAGNAFQSTTGTAGGGSSGTGSRGGGSSAPTGIDIGRNVTQPAINLNVTVKRDAGSTVDVVLGDIRQNGEIRKAIKHEIDNS